MRFKRLVLIATLLVFLPLFGGGLKSEAQFYSVSTNALGLGWAGVNGEFSATIDRTWSLHADISWMPFRVEKVRTQHFSFRPQLRYWFTETYRHWFVGAHYMYSNFHAGVPSFMKYKYEGWGIGGGFDVGYAHPIKRNWNIEFQLGGSLLYMRYNKSNCMNCGDLVSEEKGLRLMPTKAAISLVYLF